MKRDPPSLLRGTEGDLPALLPGLDKDAQALLRRPGHGQVHLTVIRRRLIRPRLQPHEREGGVCHPGEGLPLLLLPGGGGPGGAGRSPASGAGPVRKRLRHMPGRFPSSVIPPRRPFFRHSRRPGRHSPAGSRRSAQSAGGR